MRECCHCPPCPFGTPRFVCGKRTVTEQAAKRGSISLEAAERLLQKYGVPLSPSVRATLGMIRPAPIALKLW